MKKMILFVMILLFVFSAPAIAEEKGVLGRLTKLGVDEDTLNADMAEIFFDSMPFSHYKYFDSLSSMVLALNSGSITGITVDEYTARYLMSRNEQFAEYKSPIPKNISLLHFSMLLREDETELCGKISDAIKDMKADGTLEDLKKLYIDDCIDGIEPKAVVPEQFENADTLKVALTGDRPPMDYFSGNGEPVGFNTAIMAEVGKRLGMNIEFISIETGARSISLSSGECDIVFWSELGDFENRDGYEKEDQPENTVLTEPYLSGWMAYVVKADSDVAALSDNH